MKSGYVYSFKYIPWNSDPNPTIILMYALEGINPKTGHQFRFIQGVNFTYLPRSMRRAFAKDWVSVFQRNNGNVRFTYEKLKSRYPYMDHAIRRYFYTPTYYISNLIEIPYEKLEETIISTWSKDFSKKVKVSLLQKFRSSMRGRQIVKRKAERNLDKYRI